jgi:hypothetical protein
MQLPEFKDTGFRVFSQTDEDGILVYIFSLIGFSNKILVDMAFGSPHSANTTNLLCNWGFYGLLIEGNENGVKKSREFFSLHPDTKIFQPKIEHAWITAENVNDILTKNKIEGEIDLFSLDIDGMDYYIWKELKVISPRVVILEACTFLGKEKSIAVPYNSEFNRFDIHEDFFGASIPAFIKLGKAKGYRLVACNRFGFNLVFVREDIIKDLLPEISVGDCFYFQPTELKDKREERLQNIINYNWVKV